MGGEREGRLYDSPFDATVTVAGPTVAGRFLIGSSDYLAGVDIRLRFLWAVRFGFITVSSVVKQETGSPRVYQG